jgi:hypothetical protein
MFNADIKFSPPFQGGDLGVVKLNKVSAIEIEQQGYLPQPLLTQEGRNSNLYFCF